MLIKDPPVEITSHLLMLGTNEYPLFLFQGEKGGTIIEGGVGSMGPLLGEQLEKLGIGLDSIRQVIITHAHPDHVMAVPLLRKMIPGIIVIGSEIASKTLASAKAISFFRQVDEALTGSLSKEGRITEAHRPPPLEVERIAVDRTVKEGDTIQVDDGFAFTVLETPGHSDCSLSFHEPDSRLLFISDATGYYIPGHRFWWPNYFTGYAAYLDSMERLAKLEAEILCLSHNGVIQGGGDVQAYFNGALSATREYHDRIIQRVKAGMAVRQIAGELGAEVHDKTQLLPLDFFQKNCGLLVKQSLEHEGIDLEK